MGAKVIRYGNEQIIHLDLDGGVAFEDVQYALSEVQDLIKGEFPNTFCIVLVKDDHAKYSMSPNIIKEFQSLMDVLADNRGGLLVASKNPSMGYMCQHLKGLVRPFGGYDEAQQFAHQLIRTRTVSN